MSSRPAAPASETGDPLLLTPGPLTTSKRVKEVMVHDWGSRDAAFLRQHGGAGARARDLRRRRDFVTVPMQGSGTFAVEAMLTTFIPRNGGVLILINGAYGHRAKKFAKSRARGYRHETPEDTPPDLAAVEKLLAGNANDHACFRRLLRDHIRHPQSDRRRSRARGEAWQALAGGLHERLRRAAARCAGGQFGRGRGVLQQMHRGIPGLGFVVARKDALAKTDGNATTLTLDLHDQWRNFEKTGQYRFTPPIHVIVSFHQALQEFLAEGGVPAGAGAMPRIAAPDRGYARPRLRAAAGAMQAPIIVTFRMPADPKFRVPDASTTSSKNAAM